MAMGQTRDARRPVEVYSTTARTLHWLTVLLLAAQIPVGFFMVWYGAATEFAAPTAQLYDAHKLSGLLILALVLVRLANRLVSGAPAPEPTIAPWQKVVSTITHAGLYAMLLVVPVLGYLGVSYYGPFEPFGIKLPRLTGDSEANATFFFFAHASAAIVLVLLIGMHVGAALFHFFVHKDDVLGRMWPALLRRRD